MSVSIAVLVPEIPTWTLTGRPCHRWLCALARQLRTRTRHRLARHCIDSLRLAVTDGGAVGLLIFGRGDFLFAVPAGDRARIDRRLVARYKRRLGAVDPSSLTAFKRAKLHRLRSAADVALDLIDLAASSNLTSVGEVYAC